MDDFPEAHEGSAYMPLRNRKEFAFESEKMVPKSSKKKSVQLTEVQKEVQEVTSTTFLIPTNTIIGATEKTPEQATTFELHVKKNRLRKTVLPDSDNEEEDEDEKPLIRRTKVVNKDTLNIYVEDVQEGPRLIVVALLNEAMYKPSFVEALQKKTEVLEMEAERPSVVGTSDLAEKVATQSHEIIEKEVLPTSVIVDAVNTSIDLNLISDDDLNSSNSPFMTKYPTPTPPQSPKSLSKNAFSPQHHVPSSIQHSYDSDIIPIARLLRNFSQQDIVLISSVIEDFPY